MYTYISLSLYIYIYVCTHIYIYIYIHILIHLLCEFMLRETGVVAKVPFVQGRQMSDRTTNRQ